MAVGLMQVCKKVMRYGSTLQNANTARELHQVIARAVQRYINHAEQLSLQKVSCEVPFRSMSFLQERSCFIFSRERSKQA